MYQDYRQLVVVTSAAVVIVVINATCKRTKPRSEMFGAFLLSSFRTSCL